MLLFLIIFVCVFGVDVFCCLFDLFFFLLFVIALCCCFLFVSFSLLLSVWVFSFIIQHILIINFT